MQNLFFKEANSVIKDIGLQTFSNSDPDTRYTTKTKGALSILYTLLSSKLQKTGLEFDPCCGMCVRLRMYLKDCK